MVSTDYTWDAVEQFEWCFAEVNASILCACAPALKPFFSRYIPGLLSSHFRSRDHHGSPKNTGPSFQSSPSHVSGQSKSNTYEMEVHDNVSIDTTTNQQNTADDEMRLWTRNASGGNSMTGTSTLWTHQIYRRKRDAAALETRKLFSQKYIIWGILRAVFSRPVFSTDFT